MHVSIKVNNQFLKKKSKISQAIDITETEDKPPLRLVAYELNYQLIKNELLRGDMDTKCRLIQALRWVSKLSVGISAWI